MQIVGIFLAFLVTISIVAVLAHRIRIAYPIALLIVGMLMALIPNMPHHVIPPDTILVLFLPPLLMEAAFYTSLREFKKNIRPILLLAIGLVAATSAGVAWTTVHFIPGMTWALGFVIGAMVSPPDAIAATSVIKHMRIPKRIIAILEGESLVNDATGLVIYKFAVAAVVTGTFSLLDTSAQFVWMIFSGIAIGGLLGWAYMEIFPHIREPSVEILSTFILPYIAYICAEAAHSSGVIAVVTTGLIVGWMAPEKFPPTVRLPAESIWKIAVFILNGLVFLFIGWQFPAILNNLCFCRIGELALYGLLICVTTVVIRFAWVYAMAYGIRYLFPSIRAKDPYPSWQNIFIISWSGMRGVVTLATALALPLTIATNDAFPYRDLLIFLAVCVIFFTLVFQGLLLPWLAGFLTLEFDPKIIWEDWNARVQATRQVLSKISELESKDDIHKPALERIRSHYLDRLESLGDGPNSQLSPSEQTNHKDHPIIQSENQIWHEVVETERQTIINMRKSFNVNDDVMHDILHDIDLVAARLPSSNSKK